MDAFLKGILELEGVSANAIRDCVRCYLAVYQNLVRDTEPDPKNREAASPSLPLRCQGPTERALP